MVSYNTRMRWLIEILNGHWVRCVNMFRMDADTLKSLSYELETMYGLKPSRRMSVIEKVGMFLYTLALGASNREVQERFQHSSVQKFQQSSSFCVRASCWFNQTCRSRIHSNTTGNYNESQIHAPFQGKKYFLEVVKYFKRLQSNI